MEFAQKIKPIKACGDLGCQTSEKIMEPDYGCEERPDDYVAMDKVLLRDENGSEIDIEIADKDL